MDPIRNMISSISSPSSSPSPIITSYPPMPNSPDPEQGGVEATPSPFTVQIILMVIGATTGLIFNGYVLFVLFWSNRSGSGRGGHKSHIKSANSLLLFHLALSGLLLSALVLFGNVPLGYGIYSTTSYHEATTISETGTENVPVESLRYSSASSSSSSSSWEKSNMISESSAPVPPPTQPRLRSKEIDYETDLSELIMELTDPISPRNSGNDDDDRLRNVFMSIHGFIWRALPVVILWNVVAISSDRFTAINSPLLYTRLVSSRKTLMFIFICWILGTVLALPPLFGLCPYEPNIVRVASSARCSQSREETGHWEAMYSIVYLLVAFLTPLLFIAICNVHILIIARSHRSRIVSAIFDTIGSPIHSPPPPLHCHSAVVSHQFPSHDTSIHPPTPVVAMNSSGSGGEAKNSYYMARYTRGQDGIWVMCELVGSILLLLGPLHVSNMIDTFDLVSSGSDWEYTYQVATALGATLMCWFPSVTAYIYGIKSRYLRSTFKRLIAQYLYRKEVTIEIDRRLSLRSQSSLKAAIGWHSLISSTASLATGHRLSTSSASGYHPHYSTRMGFPLNGTVPHHLNRLNQYQYERQRRYSAPMPNLCRSVTANSSSSSANGATTLGPLGRREFYSIDRAQTASHSLDLSGQAPANNLAASSSESSMSNNSIDRTANLPQPARGLHYNTIASVSHRSHRYPKIQFNIFSSAAAAESNEAMDALDGEDDNHSNKLSPLSPEKSPSYSATSASSTSPDATGSGSRERSFLSRWTSLFTGGDKSSTTANSCENYDLSASGRLPLDHELSAMNTTTNGNYFVNNLVNNNNSSSKRGNQCDNNTNSNNKYKKFSSSSLLNPPHQTVTIEQSNNQGNPSTSSSSSSSFLSASGIKSWITTPNYLTVAKAQLSPIAEMSSASTATLGSPMLTGSSLAVSPFLSPTMACAATVHHPRHHSLIDNERVGEEGDEEIGEGEKKEEEEEEENVGSETIPLKVVIIHSTGESELSSLSTSPARPPLRRQEATCTHR